MEVFTMPAKKKTEIAAEAAVQAAAEVTAAPAETAAPAADASAAVKKPGRKPAAKKAPAEKKAAAKKAPAAKKTAAKKAPAEKKTAAKTARTAKAAKSAVKVQFGGSEFDVEAIKKAVDADVKAKFTGKIKSLEIYIKPEESTAYYVVNSDFSDKVELQ
jgi:hypothetical protein